VHLGGAGPLNVNLGRPLLPRKLLELEIKDTIRCGKVLASGTNFLPLGGVQGTQGPLM